MKQTQRIHQPAHNALSGQKLGRRITGKGVRLPTANTLPRLRPPTYSLPLLCHPMSSELSLPAQDRFYCGLYIPRSLK